jgi:TPP-dependent pyruvate/acetoin dehydrogenase alpha subunit
MTTLDSRVSLLQQEALLSEVEPCERSDDSNERLVNWLRQMLLIREFEEAAQPLSRDGKIPAGAHPAVGQEAVAVGIAAALAADDIAAGSHRAHHHVIAKGLPVNEVMAELFGRSTGSARGRGGTMHVADFDRGFYGSNGIGGAGVGLALGAALASRLRHSGQVAVGFFGDGGANTGRVWEFVNLAAVWQLPLIIVCENNLYAVDTPITTTLAASSISERAEGFGLPVLTVDGQDVCAMHRATIQARARAAAGDGPTFIEAETYRYYGHSTGNNPEPYRTSDEILRWRSRRDPILRVWRRLADTDPESARQQVADAEREARRMVGDAIAYAETSPWPPLESAIHDVTDSKLFTIRSHALR